MWSQKVPYLFSGSEDKTLRCWDLEKLNAAEGCQIKNFHGHVGGIYAISLHPQLDVVLSGGRDAVVRIWDIRATKEITLLSGHKVISLPLNHLIMSHKLSQVQWTGPYDYGIYANKIQSCV